MNAFFALILLLLSNGLFAQENSYSLEIPEELAKEIEDYSFDNFGELKTFTLSINSENDNLLHGIGAAVGLKAVSGVEGDDLGKTFALDLEMLWEYERAELAIEFFSDLYSRFAPDFNELGVYSEVDSEGRTLTENLLYEGVRVRLARDLSERYFLSFELEAASENDRGLSSFIQNFFHSATSNWDNAQGGKQVQYNYLDYIDRRLLFSGRVGLGRHFTLYNTRNTTVTTTVEIGQRLSTEQAFRASYVESSLDIILNQSRFRFYGEYDTRDNYVYGASFEQDLISNDRYRLSFNLGISKEDRHYNDLFPDLRDHEFGSERLRNNDITYQYGFRLRY